jgi:two-component system CheB/CheR fusion protein
MAGLEHELRTVRAELQATIRTLEIANEEALSATEEVQSANEELMSSKEELQALNEELMALNSQLQETLERHRATAAPPAICRVSCTAPMSPRWCSIRS